MTTHFKIIHIHGEPSHWCPGCKMLHRINVNKANTATFALWHWDGDEEAPTFWPDISIASVGCHYFLKEGKIKYADDCVHELAGRTVGLSHIPGEAIL